MLNLQQAIEIKESILEYLKATFTFQDKEVHNSFYDFVTHPKNGIFKGPYLSLRLPFVTANKEEEESVPLLIKPNWPPYDHQVKSWNRLSTQDKKPEPTIVTTGTGSGKTESFIYPVLDYCYRNQHKSGVKVIILYPMNALATDQAKRLAEAIYEDKRTRYDVTAGLFIGEGENSDKYPKVMGESNIIENRNSIIDSPPDILLTNFKMLDYALMKSEFHNLWQSNLKDDSLLQFLVLDELHTYDGAQGTDVANLIRRLKLKINIPQNQLCPIGTSATIGSGEDSARLLSEYASKIFGETINEEALITENRISADVFFHKELRKFIPSEYALNSIKPLVNEKYENFILRQISIWQINPNNLEDELKKNQIVKDLVVVLNSGKGVLTLKEVVTRLSRINSNYKSNISEWNDEFEFNPKEAVVISLFSIISEAKIIDSTTKRKTPLLYSQVQLWIRELSGVLREISPVPKFTWKNSIEKDNSNLALPPWYCRECGASGWLGSKHDNKERFEKDINEVYSKFFENNKHIFLFNQTEKFSAFDANEVGYESTDQFKRFLSSKNLELDIDEGEGYIDVTAFRKLNKNNYSEHVCPECNSKNTISIIGTRTATLSSIAVSQVLASDMDAQNERDRKVLAFTNSVQDAAHQAGFVEARNYRFTFRSSLQKVINNLNEDVDIQTLSESFLRYWKQNSDESGKKPIDAYYYRFYPKDYLGKSSPEDYKDDNSYSYQFIKEFDERIKWEVFSEFGYNAIMGRTLEKTGSSATYFNKENLLAVWEQLLPWIKNNGQETLITKDVFIRYLVLLLHRIRTRGAIDHEYLDKFRNGSLKLWDLNWMRDSRHFLNKKFGPKTRIPKLITSQQESRGLLDSSYGKKSNWFHTYFRKSFEMASNNQDFLNEFYEELFKRIEQVGIFNKNNNDEILNYTLNPNSIIISNNVKILECTKCGHKVYLADDDEIIEGSKCLKYRCSGEYKIIIDNTKNNYYKKVYNRSRSPRIYAADHTGLLERKEREILEIDFKTRPNFNSKNVMVATSTLEMGIDIGSLNTAFNNSIPPQTSNFLQRVGRAGRLTGSALLVNFSQTKAHDLFYYEDPKEMMVGEINTPGCYIEAKEILKRHFLAFCIDSWSSINPSENNIPAKIKYLKIESTDLDGHDFFINKILSFVRSNEIELFERFEYIYSKDVSHDVLDELKYALDSEQFYISTKNIFKVLKDEIISIKKLRKGIDTKIKDLNLGVEDDTRKELENEKRNLNGLVRSIKDRITLEHLTNVGLLPNYAFPETGVTLSAKVIANKAEGSNKEPKSKDYEIVRSQTMALKEFAPDNYFYSQSNKFKITGVNTFDWSDKSVYHKKRFCSNCDHIEIAETAMRGVCPKCGDESWNSASNVHSFAKFTTVKSFNNQLDSSLDDNSDERENLYYTRAKHIKFDKSKSRGAWAMKEIPFGIEFVKNIIVTDTNLGRGDIVNSRKTEINGKEVPTHGFITCKHCGKSTSNINQRVNNKEYKQHYAYCKFSDVEYDGKSDEVFDEVYFFTEKETEALRILLPIQDFNSEAEVNMFKAGIELGLRKYFKGNPNHINIASYREYNDVTGKFDKYLVLYDTVPGGTGYLEKLFDYKEFNILLNNAYEELKNCNCQHEGKDGCYRCIYSYNNQYYQEDLSREKAEKRFKSLVDKSENWEKYNGGLNNISNNGNIEESELEYRFIKSIKRFSLKNNNWRFEERRDDDSISYILEYLEGENQFNYHIRPQVSLGTHDGVEYATRPDFLIICTSAIVNGKSIGDNILIPKVAIYMDGYQYHASKEHNRFGNDYKKRLSIKESKDYISWTLTWDDLEIFDKQFEDNKNELNQDFLSSIFQNKDFKANQNAINKLSKKSSSFYKCDNSLERLLFLFKRPMFDDIFYKELSLLFAMFQVQFGSPSYPPNAINDSFNSVENFQTYCNDNKTIDGLLPVNFNEKFKLFHLKSSVNIKSKSIYTNLELVTLEVIEKIEWNKFWIIFNLLQFSEFVSTEDQGYEDESIDVNQVIEYYDIEFHDIIRDYFNKWGEEVINDVDKLNSLEDKNGELIAEAELVLIKDKIVYQPFSDDDKKVFLQNGFEIKE